MALKRERREELEQSWFVKWFTLVYKDELMFMINNGVYVSIRLALRLRAQGLLAGMPDLMLLRMKHGYGGLFIEMKHTPIPARLGKPSRKGVLSPVQKVRIKQIRERGYKVVVAHGWIAAKEAVEEYLKEDI